jgi:hypothetical protein
MKKIVNTKKALTDDIYYVSAADVADKIMDQIRRGLDPLLLCSSPLSHISVGRMLSTRWQREFD